jgi:glutathione S-transferase
MSGAYQGLHIWGRMSSINVKKVVWTAQELGLEFQRTEAGGLFGVVKTPEYMQLNPNSLVPVIEDDGYVLWESNVVVRYLCAKHASGDLYPTELRDRFDAERWMDWQQTTLNPASRPGFWQLVRTPPEQRNADVIAQSNAAVEALMATLDAHLARRSFMVGERFSMADIPLACEVHRWFGLPQPRQSRPHIERWYAGLCARQTSKGVLDLALS